MKIFVDVKTPGNGKTYEFQLDNTMTVGQAKARMIEEIREMENGNITLDPAKAVVGNLSTEARLADTAVMAAVAKSGQSLLLL